jgi:general L-amino acid transport system permease protein
MVTLFASAYIAEVVRGGLAALPRGQYEGADSLGLDYWQAMRLIILPQALKISIPGIVNTFIGLCFFVCCYGMSRYSQWLERKLRTDHR